MITCRRVPGRSKRFYGAAAACTPCVTFMTKALTSLKQAYLSTQAFLDKLDENLKKAMA
jgi:hypothetical protein